MTSDMVGDTAQNRLGEELVAWIGAIPFSRPARNLTKDFSDGVLVAEILKVYYPRHVELHNYISASNLNTKVENWNTLNRKVLAKLDLKLSRERISHLANASQDAIEKLLAELRVKILRDRQHELRKPRLVESNVESVDVRISKEKIGDDTSHGKFHPEREETSDSPEVDGEAQRPTVPRIRHLRIVTVFSWMISLFRIWNIFSYIFNCKLLRFGRCTRNVPADLANEQKKDNETVTRATYIELKQELHEKEELICTLNHKIVYLESSLKLKDLRISGLTEQIVQNAVEVGSSAKLQPRDGARVKLRSRSHNFQESKTN